MAARRLLIIMVVLLVLSSVAAALVPPPTERSAPEESEEETAIESEAGDDRRRAAEVVTVRVDAEAQRPELIAVGVGDQVALTVQARAFHEVEIPALGLLQPVEPGAPARFDMLIDRSGSFLVRLAGGGRAIARIEARERARVSRSARSGESRARGRGNRAGRES
jgi:plastocyanin